MLQEALKDLLWVSHKVGDTYNMANIGGGIDLGWNIAYYPLFGTYKEGKWVEFKEPRALIEKPIQGGTDFREVPLRYLTKQ